MKLIKFHITDSTSCPPGHGNAVSSGSINIAGVEISFAGTTGSESCGFTSYGQSLFVIQIQKISTNTLMLSQAGFKTAATPPWAL